MKILDRIGVTMIIEECSIECIDDVKQIVRDSLSQFHAYYASICIELGKCSAVRCRNDNDVVGVGVFYVIDVKPISIGVVYYVAVERRFRGYGIGKAIVASIEELMNMRGVGFYVATTRLNNIASRKMLEELNYTGILLEKIDINVRKIIEELTCAYEDEIIYIKSSNNSVKQFLDTVLDKTNHRKIKEVWSAICYRPWIKLRQRR